MVCMMEDGQGNHLLLRDQHELKVMGDELSKLSMDMPTHEYMKAMENIQKAYIKTPKEVFKLMAEISILTTEGYKKMFMAFMEE